ncbi:hypothetical protein HPP92_004095 [Vanilla planifolia]|uniref:Methyltransferase n=1 Tax=Vanilla planifolia TaxID=51239 RepID=A0A835VG44_VANPL|nr:hypothetical protein HPP92_004095 [Vanilla planifolia]
MTRPIQRGLRISVENQGKQFAGNGFTTEFPSPAGGSRNRQSPSLCLLKIGLVVLMVLALLGSLYWTVSISSFSRDNIYRGYQRLQEQLVADLSDIGKLSHDISKLNEVEFCPPKYENYVPCYGNISDESESADPDSGVEYERKCVAVSGTGWGCLVLPPRDYRIPLRWPSGRDFIWKENVKIKPNEFSMGSLTKRMMVEEQQISFRSDSLMVDGVEDYVHQLAEMIELSNDSEFNEAGIRTVLDIGCGFGSFGAHLFSKQLLTMCIAGYEVSGSQVQVTLERGMPAMIGSFVSKHLPFPDLSFDMLHCARCGIEWEKNDGVFLVEVDRLLRPGGYFIWTSPLISARSLLNEDSQKKWTFIREFSENICWDLLSQQGETVLWKKTSTTECYNSRKSGPVICGRDHDIESPHYQPVSPCVGGIRSERWIPIHKRKSWPSRADLSSDELSVHGLQHEEFAEDSMNWNAAVPLLKAGRSVWVMNVVPINGRNYLPLIFDRGLVGVVHDWCEAFPTYPRTYDMVHAERLLSLIRSQHNACSMLDVFLEIDRILRPEGWVILRDSTSLIEAARCGNPTYVPHHKEGPEGKEEQKTDDLKTKCSTFLCSIASKVGGWVTFE